MKGTTLCVCSLGKCLVVEHVYWLCVISIEGNEIFANLMVLNMMDFDVILSMDWLASCHVIDCQLKAVKFNFPKKPSFII